MIFVSLITFHPKELAVQHFKDAHGIDLTGDVDEYACEPCDQRCFVWRTNREPSEPESPAPGA
jgi:hypothetical protein